MLNVAEQGFLPGECQSAMDWCAIEPSNPFAKLLAFGIYMLKLRVVLLTIRRWLKHFSRDFAIKKRSNS